MAAIMRDHQDKVVGRWSELALTDGWSIGGGLGLGLSGARRLVDEFELISKAGGGTSVVVVKWSR
jgi:serine/threonine-protein kinase RsbT